ncbi:MAG: asparagine synthetase B, partial [Oricola sp.]
MADSLDHRGPDDGGSWADGAAGIGLGHRRLSIIDLSAAGHQPMISANRRYVLSYNGEVYNAVELRQECEAAGISFRGSSDTEVLVETIARHGLRKTLERLIGMFAFALWDRELRELTLV